MLRLIPAHAGKTEPNHRAGCAAQAHPRSRGENLRMGRKLLEKDGSSPLTRGKLTCERTDHFSNRLIPAHAGKTVKQPPHPLSLSAHPRSRGENERGLSSFVRLIGSSPLTRGKHERVGPFAPGGRLIPAHAGKTLRRVQPLRRLPAHPRSRGENFLGIAWSVFQVRLIPAHAGKTQHTT